MKIMPIKGLVLGCGERRKETTVLVEWINSDTEESLSDKNCKWTAGMESAPWPDNHFDQVFSEHSLEHVPNIHYALKELYRITKKNGTWKIIVPYGFSQQDNLFHVTMGFNIRSFHKFFGSTSRGYGQYMKLEPIRISYQAVGWKRLLPFKHVLGHFLNNIWYQITYELKVIK